MKRLFIISLVVSLLLTSVSAQTLTNQQRRHINSKILTLIEDYERYASLYDEEAAYYYRSLFVNETSTVHCDMIASDKYRTQVPVDEYISMVRQNSQNTTTVIKDVKKGEMSYANGVWYIPVTFRKSFSYIDPNGYLFSVEDWHKADFDMEMYVLYDEERDLCLIQSITGKLDTTVDFPKGRFLIVNEMKDRDDRYMGYFSTLRINNRPLEFNDFGQAIIAPGIPHVDDMDVAVDTVVLSKGYNYDVVSYEFNPRKARVKLRYGYSPNAYRKISGADGFDVKSPAMEVGVDFGIAFPAGRNAKMGLYTGVGAMQSGLQLQLSTTTPSFGYTYSTAQRNDATGLWESKEVVYKISEVNESVKYIDLFVPVYFEMEHRIGNYLMLSWSLGAKGYYNLMATPGEHTVQYTVDGERTNLTRTFDKSYYKKAIWDVSAFGNIGLDVNLLKRKMYFMVRVGYEYGFMPTFKSDAAPYYYNNKNNPEKSYPIIRNAENDDVVVHPMINGLEFNRQGLWISGGLKFKL